MARRSNTSIGPMSARSAHVPHFVPPRQVFEPSARVTNASSSGRLNLAHEWRGCFVHPDRLKAFSLPSRSFEGLKYPKLIVGQNLFTAESAPSELRVGEIAQEALDA